jgi:hypothetical protein
LECSHVRGHEYSAAALLGGYPAGFGYHGISFFLSWMRADAPLTPEALSLAALLLLQSTN